MQHSILFITKNTAKIILIAETFNIAVAIPVILSFYAFGRSIESASILEGYCLPRTVLCLMSVDRYMHQRKKYAFDTSKCKNTY